MVILGVFFCASCALMRDRDSGRISESEPVLADLLRPRWTVDRALYDSMKSGGGSIGILLAEQRLTLWDREGRAVIETDCSTGVLGKETPTGRLRVLEKIQDKRSNKYGSYVSVETGDVVEPRSWLVNRPPGTRFLGTAMPYWMRLTWAGVGIHVGGFQRGLRTSMGCIRMPEGVQPLIFEKAFVGMPVRIE